MKVRLDQAVLQQHPELSRAQAQSWIMQGQVRVNGIAEYKPGRLVSSDAHIVLTVTTPRYVSRAGVKLEAALEAFKIVVTGKVALDAGISTGGFTDCLLQRGAARIYGVDVGYGLVHESVRHNPRVVVLERTNLRHLEQLPELVDLVTLDLSFISVTKVMEKVALFLKEQGELIILIKPQFEAGREHVGKGGIVSDPYIHQGVIKQITTAIERVGFISQGVIPSPILGASGNQEFLAYFMKRENFKTLNKSSDS